MKEVWLARIDVRDELPTLRARVSKFPSQAGPAKQLTTARSRKRSKASTPYSVSDPRRVTKLRVASFA